jgi:hypothetical protein
MKMYIIVLVFLGLCGWGTYFFTGHITASLPLQLHSTEKSLTVQLSPELQTNLMLGPYDILLIETVGTPYLSGKVLEGPQVWLDVPFRPQEVAKGVLTVPKQTYIALVSRPELPADKWSGNYKVFAVHAVSPTLFSQARELINAELKP